MMSCAYRTKVMSQVYKPANDRRDGYNMYRNAPAFVTKPSDKKEDDVDRTAKGRDGRSVDDSCR